MDSLAEMALRGYTDELSKEGNSVQCLDLIMKASDEQIGNISKHIETVTTLLSVCGNFMQFNALRVLLNMGDEDLARVQAHSELIRDLVRISGLSLFCITGSRTPFLTEGHCLVSGLLMILLVSSRNRCPTP